MKFSELQMFATKKKVCVTQEASLTYLFKWSIVESTGKKTFPFSLCINRPVVQILPLILINDHVNPDN
jgi:hypothetical protein